MRTDLPISHVEYAYAEDDLMISQTNLKGESTCANPAFVQASQRDNNFMSEISAASQEQSSGISQIGRAINVVEQGAQHTAGQLQSTNRAPQTLEKEAHQLLNAIHAFRTTPSGTELTLEISALVGASDDLTSQPFMLPASMTVTSREAK